MPTDHREAARLEQLHEAMRQLESGLAHIHADTVLQLLRLRSTIEALAAELEEKTDLEAERTRLKALDALLESHAARIVTAAARQGGLRAAREALAPGPEEWWWFLDERVGARLRLLATRLGAALIGVVLVALLGYYLWDTFFALPSYDKEALGYTTLAEQLLYLGEYEVAREQYERAVRAQPGLAEAWAALAVLYEREGRMAEAQAARANAERLMGDRSEFLLVLAQQYVLIRELDQALACADNAVHIAPQAAKAYLVRGEIYERMGHHDLAVADWERASELALEHGQEALYILASSRLGVLMQQEDVALPESLTP